MNLLRRLAGEIANPVTRPTFWAFVSSIVTLAWPGHAIPQQVQDVVVAVAGLIAAVDVGGRYALHVTLATTQSPQPPAATSPPPAGVGGGQ